MRAIEELGGSAADVVPVGKITPPGLRGAASTGFDAAANATAITIFRREIMVKSSGSKSEFAKIVVLVMFNL